MIQTQQFLQQQIDTTTPFKYKNQLENIKHQEAVNRYHQLNQLYMRGEEQRIMQDIEIEELNDKIALDKILMQQSLIEMRRKMSMADIAKQQLLANCQQNELKIGQLNKIYQENKDKEHKNGKENDLLKRKILENEAVKQKSQNQCHILRKKLQKQLENIEECKMNSKYHSITTQLYRVIERNIEVIDQIKNKSYEKIVKNRGNPKQQSDRLQLLSAETEMKMQEEKNRQVKMKIQAEKYVRETLQTKIALLQKINIIRQLHISKQADQNKVMEPILESFVVQNHTIKQKLHHLQNIQLQLAATSQNLKQTLQINKAQDKKCLQNMNISSHRLQKRLDARHLLADRRNMVEQYKKYILGTKE